MKICQLGAELFHADRPMDMTKLSIGFRNFADTPRYKLKPTVVIYRTDSPKKAIMNYTR
jgi:hypothetical protein